jgi:hypothetical protein
MSVEHININWTFKTFTDFLYKNHFNSKKNAYYSKTVSSETLYKKE